MSLHDELHELIALAAILSRHDDFDEVGAGVMVAAGTMASISAAFTSQPVMTKVKPTLDQDS